jgi:hypothetical protein
MRWSVISIPAVDCGCDPQSHCYGSPAYHRSVLLNQSSAVRVTLSAADVQPFFVFVVGDNHEKTAHYPQPYSELRFDQSLRGIIPGTRRHSRFSLPPI